LLRRRQAKLKLSQCFALCPFGFSGNRMQKCFWVYMVTDKPYGTLYTGITNSLARRSYEHREGLYTGFTKKYGLKMLVWYQEFPTALEAIEFEKRIKKWKRDWKKQLIEKFNPTWRDLYEELQ
jgi:putative endonuclease